MAQDQDEVDLRDTIIELMATRFLRKTLPILVVFFTPITVLYQPLFEPVFSVFFFFGRLDFNTYHMRFFLEPVFYNPPVLLFVSVPALVASIAASWALHRLSQKKTDKGRALMEILGVTIVWAIYLSVVFFSGLSIGRVLVGPFPVPFGPLVAVLSRESIMKLTEQIDELERLA